MSAQPLKFADLPAELPIFPLTGALLLPGGQLPLNIFEPRYIAMFRDAMATPHRLIGMVQASEPEAEMGGAPIYHTGCAGRLTAFSETSDGRYLVTLSGIIRFDALAELPTSSAGYRRVQADYLSYDTDLESEPCPMTESQRTDMLQAVRTYFDRQGFDTDWEALGSAAMGDLVPSLAMACPFSAAEKQALLEAPTLAERTKVLIGLFHMGAAMPLDGETQVQ